MNIDEYRQPGHIIEKLIYHRWSPRAMSGEPISEADLMRLFEAARWAPSSYNAQHWAFFYARRNSAHWDTYFDLLVAANQQWVQHAAALIVIASRNFFEHNNEPARTHSFDTGAAAQNLALQASAMGLVCHAMQGFSYERAATTVGIADLDFSVEAMLAIGWPGAATNLPEAMQQREFPSDRKPLTKIAFEGVFQP